MQLSLKCKYVVFTFFLTLILLYLYFISSLLIFFSLHGCCNVANPANAGLTKPFYSILIVSGKSGVVIYVASHLWKLNRRAVRQVQKAEKVTCKDQGAF